jgi:hypothetical protein
MKLKDKIKKQKLGRERLKYEQSAKVDALVKSWNPLPVRGQTLPRLSSTIQKNSNFINCRQGVMNVGKYKGIELKDVPVWYLKWVVNNIELNQTELEMIRKRIK